LTWEQPDALGEQTEFPIGADRDPSTAILLMSMSYWRWLEMA
jgi:hypothetical protein